MLCGYLKDDTLLVGKNGVMFFLNLAGNSFRGHTVYT